MFEFNKLFLSIVLLGEAGCVHGQGSYYRPNITQQPNPYNAYDQVQIPGTGQPYRDPNANIWSDGSSSGYNSNGNHYIRTPDGTEYQYKGPTCIGQGPGQQCTGR